MSTKNFHKFNLFVLKNPCLLFSFCVIFIYRKIGSCSNNKNFTVAGTLGLLKKRRLEMTKGDAKMLETDMGVFSVKSAQEKNLENVLTEQLAGKNIVEVETTKIDIKARFARLKKSLRKRSASIL